MRGITPLFPFFLNEGENGHKRRNTIGLCRQSQLNPLVAITELHFAGVGDIGFHAVLWHSCRSW